MHAPYDGPDGWHESGASEGTSHLRARPPDPHGNPGRAFAGTAPAPSPPAGEADKL
jgi:hypothetical protein